jgi:hypothetical protein
METYLNPSFYASKSDVATGVDSRGVKNTCHDVEGLLKNLPFEKPKYRNSNGTRRETPNVSGMVGNDFAPSFVPTATGFKNLDAFQPGLSIVMPPKLRSGTAMDLVLAVAAQEQANSNAERPIGTIDTIKAYSDKLTQASILAKTQALIDQGYKMDEVLKVIDKVRSEQIEKVFRSRVPMNKMPTFNSNGKAREVLTGY